MRKKILYIVDNPRWAIARNVNAICNRLSHLYDFDKALFHSRTKEADGYLYVNNYNPEDYDLIIYRSCVHIESDFAEWLERCDRNKVCATVASHHVYDVPVLSQKLLENARLFKSIMCVSDSTFERGRKFFRDNDMDMDVYFTPQGIETDKFCNKRTRRNDEFTIGWAGNVKHRNDHKRFFKVIMPLIEQTHNKYKYNLALTNADSTLMQTLNSTANVTASRVKFDDMINYYNSIDLYLNVSRSEAIASTTCEAVACGTPVVTTPVGHARNIIADGVNGKLVNANVPELIDAIEIFKDKDYSKIFKINKFVAEHVYNWDILLSHTEIAINKIIRRNSN